MKGGNVYADIIDLGTDDLNIICNSVGYNRTGGNMAGHSSLDNNDSR